jgi:hypothetical protein
VGQAFAHLRKMFIEKLVGLSCHHGKGIRRSHKRDQRCLLEMQ